MDLTSEPLGEAVTVDLGFPITVLYAADLVNNELRAKKKVSLRSAIELGGLALSIGKSWCIPYHWWFNLTSRWVCRGSTNPDGCNGGVAWEVGPFKNVGHLARNMSGLGPGLS